MKIKNYSTVIFVLLCLLSLLTFPVFAADLSVQDEAKEASFKSGVFILMAEEFKLASTELSGILIKNGFDPAFVKVYIESDQFGVKEFSQEVIKHSLDLKSVMVSFHFHGADAGGCAACDAQRDCLQGNLCVTDHNYISARQIVDDFITPLEGKNIVLFFRSCFSGHFAKKVEQLAIQKVWQKPTPLALISTDNNTETLRFSFPNPDYSLESTKFNLWKDLASASQYEQMDNFFDYVRFVNTAAQGFTFTFLEVNNGKDIGLAQFGFKDLRLQPHAELVRKNNIYKRIEDRLSTVDVSNLKVLFVERDRDYENLVNGDMWLNAFLKNGVLRENIHWIKPAKTGADLETAHGFFEDFDFIGPKHQVLLFIRGDDVTEGVFMEPNQWNMVFGQDRFLSAERISTVLLPKLNQATRVLVLICSTHADVGFAQLVPTVANNEALRNVSIVSFYSPAREFNWSKIAGWPMGFLAPLYAAEFLFYTDGSFQDLYPHDARVREFASTGFSLFEKMESFESYLEFLQKAERFPIPKVMAGKTYNSGPNDLRDFGFLPSHLPSTWYRW